MLPEQRTDLLNVTSDSMWQTRRICNTSRNYAYVGLPHKNNFLFYFQNGLLMSVIRTLSASESNEQRDREKAKLEKEYKRSDQKLDELISLHDQDLTQVMQVHICDTYKSIHALDPARPVPPRK
jgi:hypothetical protein